jgi:hypothetical protein
MPPRTREAPIDDCRGPSIREQTHRVGHKVHPRGIAVREKRLHKLDRKAVDEQQSPPDASMFLRIGTFGQPGEHKEREKVVELVVGCDRSFAEGSKGQERDDEQGNDEGGTEERTQVYGRQNGRAFQGRSRAIAR